MTVRFTAPRRAVIRLGQARAPAASSNLTIDQILAAVQVDAAAVGGLELFADRSVSGRLTLRLVDPSAQPLLRRLYISTVRRVSPTEDQWLNGTGGFVETSDSNQWDAAFTGVDADDTRYYYHLAYPDTLATLDSFMFGPPAGVFEYRPFFTPAVGSPDVIQNIGGIDHRVYIGAFTQAIAAFGVNVIIGF